MKELISRDSFCAPEIQIFNAIREWANLNQSVDPTPILDAVRLPLMTMHELLNVVRDTNLVTADSILDAIKLQTESRDMDLQYRGFLGLYLKLFLNLGTLGNSANFQNLFRDYNQSVEQFGPISGPRFFQV